MKRRTESDWKKIKKEYVTKDVTFRDLAKKYRVSLSTLSAKSKTEHWIQERDAYRGKIVSETETKTNTNIDTFNATIPLDKKTEQAISTQAEFNMKLYRSADLLFDKINELLAMDMPLAPKDLKSISSTLIDLKMMRIPDTNDLVKDNKTVIEFVNMDWEDAEIVEVIDANTTT